MAINFNFEDVVRPIAKVIMLCFMIMMLGLVFYPLGIAFDSIKSSNSLNCPGYVDTIYNGQFSYNESLVGTFTSSLASSVTCPFLNMTAVVIILLLILSMIAWVFSNRNDGVESQPV